MNRLIVFILAVGLISCGGAPTPDPKILEATIAARVIATQTASVPTATNTPVPTNTPAVTNTPIATATPVPTSTPSVAALIPAKRVFNHKYNIKVEYDKFKDQTSVSLTPRLEAVGAKPNQLQVIFISKGTNIRVPTEVFWEFVSTSNDWQFLRISRASFLLDGAKRLSLDASQDGNVGRGYVIEFINLHIPLADFLSIVNAKKVECQVSVQEFSLSDEQLEALRDFASRMNQ